MIEPRKKTFQTPPLPENSQIRPKRLEISFQKPEIKKVRKTAKNKTIFPIQKVFNYFSRSQKKTFRGEGLL